MALEDIFQQSILAPDSQLAEMFPLIVKLWDECGKLEPSLGTFLSDFIKAYKGIEQNPDYDDSAALNMVNPETGLYSGKIIVGNRALETLESAFVKISHEAVHAIQHNKVPCLHLFPGKNSTIVLSPRSFIMVSDLIERQAYILQALFGHCLEVLEPHRKDALDRSEFPSFVYRDSFASEYMSNQSLTQVIEKERNTIAQIPRFGKTYYKHFINTYKRGIPYHEARAQIVRLDKQDMLDIINAVGPQVAEFKPFYLTYTDNEIEGLGWVSDHIAEMNKLMCIENEESLPTFRDVLSEQGILSEEFLRSRLNNRTYQPEYKIARLSQPKAPT